MKKITVILVFLMASFNGFSQIAAGSVAPDFTVTDISGVTHSLSAYLAAGKTVIMDVSATWCGPCWNYHNGKALEDVYKAYGPDGSNEVVVLFVEGDGNTPVAALSGIGNTQGNWVEGTPYPILDSALIANLYQIAYFPTVFRICPNGLVSEVGSVAATAIRTSISTNCGPLNGVVGSVEVSDSSIGLCTPSGAPTVKVKNFGKNVTGVTTVATVDLKENGVVVGTKSTTGAFAQFGSKTLTFDALTFNPGSVYTYAVNNVNSQPNFNPLFSTSDLAYTFPADTALDIIVKVYTDNYPGEISWKIKNSTGTVVASFGPYAGGAAPGGVDGNTTKIHNVALPAANECYTVEFLDSFGDGWGLGTTPHGMEIFNGTTSIWNAAVGNFGTLLAKPNALRPGTLATNNFSKNTIGVYPNPSTGLLKISTETNVSVELFDLLGKKVFTSKDVNQDTVMDISALGKGMYLAKITGANISYTEKVLLK